MGMPFVLGSGPVGVRAAAAPIPPPCNHSGCLEGGVAGYCGSSPASRVIHTCAVELSWIGVVCPVATWLPRSSTTAGPSG